MAYEPAAETALSRAGGQIGRAWNSTAHVLNSIAQDLLSKQRVVDLISEVTQKQIRSAAPEAIAAVREIIADTDHRDRLKAASVILERIEPTMQRLDVCVQHQPIGRDAEAVTYLRKLKALGVSREKLEHELGYSDLPRYERLLELEDVKSASVIEPNLPSSRRTRSMSNLDELSCGDLEEGPDPNSVRRHAKKMLINAEYLKKYRRLGFYKPHPKQLEFHNLTAVEKCLRAGNQLGKSQAGAAQMTMDAISFYHLMPCSTVRSMRSIARATAIPTWPGFVNS